jgi:hypothetical protein
LLLRVNTLCEAIQLIRSAAVWNFSDKTRITRSVVSGIEKNSFGAALEGSFIELLPDYIF